MLQYNIDGLATILGLAIMLGCMLCSLLVITARCCRFLRQVGHDCVPRCVVSYTRGPPIPCITTNTVGAVGGGGGGDMQRPLIFIVE